MNIQDKIITALTPGTPFNSNNRIYRSLDSLAAITQQDTEQVLDTLLGDLGHLVVIKPSKKKKGLFAALRDLVPAKPVETEPVKISGGNAFVAATPVGAVSAAASEIVQESVENLLSDMDEEEGDEEFEEEESEAF